jgi:hypothetical protein
VAATTGPGVQLPGVIGGPASLNLGAVFVGASGAGKGISDKVARAAWPAADITERPIGSGEGIAAMFAPPKKEGVEPITAAILSVPEIDTLAGVAARQGSILLAQLKSALMGELIGQSNASEATTRVVQAHSYRCCLSIGAQPGHAGVLFNDTTGGTPQRLLWLPTTDPTMPADPTADPEPLNTVLPSWARSAAVIVYGPSEVEQTIIAAHLARQRGEGDALDGHALLTRCKVGAVLAIMAHRTVVSELDWELSEVVMQMSDRTRNSMIEHARQASRAKIKDRAMSRAAFDEFIEGRHTETVRNRIVKLLTDGSMPRGALRRAMGKQHYREAFDAVLPHLEKISQVVVIQGDKAPHYALNPEFTGEPEFTPENSSSDGVNLEFNGEPDATIANPDCRTSTNANSPRPSCKEWLHAHLEELRQAGQQTTDLFAVLAAGEPVGYYRQSLIAEASKHPGMTIMSRRGGNTVWWIDTTQQPPYVWRPAPEWVASYIDQLSDGTVVDRDDFKSKGLAEDYSWENLRKTVKDHPHIQADSAGPNTIWTVRRTHGEAS